MHKYYLRTTRPVGEVLALGCLLGVLEPKDGGGVGAAAGVTWQPIGTLPDSSVVVGQDADGSPRYDVIRVGGAAAWHANLMCPFSLFERAQALSAANPALAAALELVEEFFVVGEDGRARAPSNPAFIFWGSEP